MIAEVNGASLAYWDAGDGIPLLCLHGGMGIDSRTLRVPGILDLARRGIRLIMPDQRGHGLSSRNNATDYSHATWANDAHALAALLGVHRLALLGHSYGGFIALEYAIRWPESLTHLILVATSAGPRPARGADVSTDSELKEWFRALWPQFFVRDDKQWSLFEDLKFSVDPYTAALTSELPRYDLREYVPNLRVPILLIVGRDDYYRPDMEWLATHAPNATLRVIDGVGHFPFIEAAAQFTDHVAAFVTTLTWS